MDIIKIYNILKKIEEINPPFVIENIFEEKFERLISLKEIDKKKISKTLKIIELIKKGEKPEYIFKKCNFLNEEFYIEKKVLIPREETSIIIDYLKELKEKNFNPQIIIDFGTGTGILAIWAKRLFPFSYVLAVDCLKKACKCAYINSKNKNTEIKVIRAKSLKNFKKEKIDLIVANPPYLSGEEYKKYGPFKGETKRSLIGGKKGYETFLKWLKEGFEVLKNRGIFISEISEFWKKDILSGFKKYLIEERRDFYNKKRVWIFKKF